MAINRINKIALRRSESWGYLDHISLRRKLDADTAALQRGISAEKFVEEAILLLKSQGKVQWYKRCRRWGKLDLLHNDFLIIFTTPPASKIVGLQVKNSEAGKAMHIAKYGKRTPCVVRYPLDTVEIMAGKILMIDFPESYKKERRRPVFFDAIDVTPEELTLEAIEDVQPEQFGSSVLDIMGEAMRKAFPDENG